LCEGGFAYNVTDLSTYRQSFRLTNESHEQLHSLAWQVRLLKIALPYMTVFFSLPLTQDGLCNVMLFFS